MNLQSMLLANAGLSLSVDLRCHNTYSNRAPLFTPDSPLPAIAYDEHLPPATLALDLCPKNPEAFQQKLLQLDLVMDYHGSDELQWTSFTDPNGVVVRVFDSGLPAGECPWPQSEFAIPVGDFRDSVNFWAHLGFSPVPDIPRQHPWTVMRNGPCIISLHQKISWKGPFFIVDDLSSAGELKTVNHFDLPSDFTHAASTDQGLLLVQKR